MQNSPWWRGAIIYQVYPRSLMDSNGDGVGDIAGIISKLDYIASLGVDAIWVSPFFRSPMKDFGYDISDYRDVDPLFGTLDDIDRLIAEAHQRGIKLIIDQVLSHTSDQHAWFLESRESKDNPKADWYVWADPSEDGTPPNNWLAIFGGSAWEWEPRREQYYLHNFLKSQPDLNFHNPAVRAQILSEVEFWLKRGIDGLRLDAINFCFHDQQLRNNPAKPAAERKGRGFSEDNPYAFQRHIYDNTRPENIEFMQEIRGLMDRYPGTVTLGEISSEDSLATMAEYTQGDKRLHMSYSFELLSDEFSAAYIRNTVETLEQGLGEGWPCWAIGNHDVSRVLTRWGGEHGPAALAKVLNAMLFSLRGSICSYQGEELGLTEAPIEQHQLQDPYGITFWPRFKGRDGCRTPMPWSDTTHGGFSDSTPWLPVPQEHLAQAVSLQDSAADSVLNAYRRFTAWRKQQPALLWGDIQFYDLGNDILAFTRASAEQTLLAVFNLSDTEVRIQLPSELREKVSGTATKGHGFTAKQFEGVLVLPAFEAYFNDLNASA
ncbi:alpha-glucosidase [uncultured Gilvimarinus sp.]|uniref:alpha-glucosidase n=1 Tax=uncultured Gilvimarinus sp. TaxID=1689143 RepID=UPI0030EEE370